MRFEALGESGWVERAESHFITTIYRGGEVERGRRVLGVPIQPDLQFSAPHLLM